MKPAQINADLNLPTAKSVLIKEKNSMYNQDKTQWLIWSIEHNGWWAPERHGYTPYRSMAGKYSTEDATKIVKDANIGDHNIPNEAMIIFSS